MANSGIDWSAHTTLINNVTLTQGGTIYNVSDAVDLDMKAACEISIDAAYSDHAKATGGLRVSVLRDIDGTNYEDENSKAMQFEMPFVQNDSVLKAFSISAADFSKFKIRIDWDNTTSSSSVDVTVRYKTGDIPPASEEA